MQLIYVTSKTKFTGIKNFEAIKKGQTIHATVLHEGKKYIAVTDLGHVAADQGRKERVLQEGAPSRRAGS